MQLLEQKKRSVNRCFNSVKLRNVLKSEVRFLHKLRDSVIIFQKSSLIYTFFCKCDVCYIGGTTQRLDILE